MCFHRSKRTVEMTENSTFHFDDILNGHFKLCFLLVRSSKRLITGAGPPSMFLHKGISFVLTAGIEPAYYSFRDCSLANSVRELNSENSLFVDSITGLEPVRIKHLLKYFNNSPKNI